MFGAGCGERGGAGWQHQKHRSWRRGVLGANHDRNIGSFGITGHGRSNLNAARQRHGPLFS